MSHQGTTTKRKERALHQDVTIATTDRCRSTKGGVGREEGLREGGVRGGGGRWGGWGGWVRTEVARCPDLLLLLELCECCLETLRSSWNDTRLLEPPPPPPPPPAPSCWLPGDRPLPPPPSSLSSFPSPSWLVTWSPAADFRLTGDPLTFPSSVMKPSSALCSYA